MNANATGVAPGDGTAQLEVGRYGMFLKPLGLHTQQYGNANRTGYESYTGGLTGGLLFRPRADLTFGIAPAFMTPAWVAANPNFLSNLAAIETASVSALQAAGARTILVPNSYNYAVFAGPGGAIAPENAALYATSKSYGTMRWSSLSAAGVRFIPADIDSLFRFVVQNPTLFGFTASSVLSANALYQSLSPLYISWADVTPAQMQSYLFIGANGVHLTTAGQQIEADYEYSLIVAPTQMSLLAESAMASPWG